MKRFFTLALLVLLSLSLFGQSIDMPEQPESVFEYEAIRKGDKHILVNLGVSLPLFNIGSDRVNSKTNLNTGGAGTIGFNQFLNSSVSLGGELTFAFNSTLGGNLYFFLPILFNVGFEPVLDRFHFPLTIGLGGAFQTYNSITYFGPMVKPRAGMYFQYSPDWSFGGNVEWSTIFQWYKAKENNRIGNILNINAGFRYHF